MSYMWSTSAIIGYVGEAELLCVECGTETLPPVFAGDECAWADSCGSCHRLLRDVV